MSKCIEIYDDKDNKEKKYNLSIDIAINEDIFYMLCLAFQSIEDTEIDTIEELFSKILFDGILQQNILFSLVNQKENDLSVFDIEYVKKSNGGMFELTEYQDNIQEIKREVLYRFNIKKEREGKTRIQHKNFLTKLNNTRHNIKTNNIEIKNVNKKMKMQ